MLVNLTPRFAFMISLNFWEGADNISDFISIILAYKLINNKQPMMLVKISLTTNLSFVFISEKEEKDARQSHRVLDRSCSGVHQSGN